MTSPLDELDISSLKHYKTQAIKKGEAKLTLSTEDLHINLAQIPNYALQVVSHLQRHNCKAYLVGGCIRDLLLGKKPKDFDVSTDATPERVRSLFTNSRIIGRRFKIVHVVQGREIIEVTTFRSNQEAVKFEMNKTRVSAQSGMLIRDNVYGKNIVEDSKRRDFTINALYLDPIKKEIYDFNGGLYDMKMGVIDIIGDPETRYSEDPVRMIRAMRFAAKLGFDISKRTLNPIKELSNHLLEVSNARMFEEVNKLFLTGHGLESFRILRKFHIFELLFPGTQSLLENQNYIDFVEYSLSSSDMRYREDKRNMPHFLYAVILWSLCQERLFMMSLKYSSSVKLVPMAELVKKILNDIILKQCQVTDMPMAVSDSIKALWRMQLTLNEIEDIKDIDEITSRNIFRAAYDFFALRAKFDHQLDEAVEFWQPYYVKSKELAERKKAAMQEKRLSRKERKHERTEKKKKDFEKVKLKKRASEEGFEDESNLSEKRRKQLEKARAWRKSMNLEV